MKLQIHLLLCIIILPLSVFSQSDTAVCGHTELQLQLQAEDATIADKRDAFEMQYLDFVQAKNSITSLDSVTLPVVIHVVHLPGTLIGEEENITEEDVKLGLDRLNNVFAGMVCDDNPLGNDMDIKFELATRDINGNATNGIVRKSSNFSVFGLGGFSFMIFNVAGFDSPFPTTDYINIYLVKSICYTMIDGECSGPLGLATSAPSHGTRADGIAIEAGIWSNEDSCLSGKLAAHEMGHYLNLLHTFENGCPNDNCLTQGDRVCDTAPDNIANRNDITCLSGTFNNSCSTDADDGYCNPFSDDASDPEDNLMDYSPFACQYLFTEGQKVRMHSALRLARTSLFESEGLTAPCTSVITTQTQWIRNVLKDSVLVYQSNAVNADSIAWLVDSVFISSDVNLSYAYPEVGEHTLTLQAFNNTGCMTEVDYAMKVYRSDCNLTANIPEIPPVCSSFNAEGFIQLRATPSGQWQDENGVFLNGAIRSEYYIGGLSPGTHSLYYTTREGWCQQTFETEFIILEDELDVSFLGGIDCASTQPAAIEMEIFAFGQGTWEDNQGNNGFFDSNVTTEASITKAGTYDFNMFTQSGEECQLSYEVPAYNNNDWITIKACNDCQPSSANLCIVDGPEDATIKWYGGYPNIVGRWEAKVINNNTGCESWGKIETTSLENLFPSCSAGSSASITCGETYTLLGVVNSLEGDIDYWWTTTNGRILGNPRTLTPTIDRAGTYEFHALNLLSGCEAIDATTVSTLSKNSIVEETICLGESYEGYTESGTYIDTLNYACDCDSIRTLNLVVSQTDITYEINDTEGANDNGSIEISDLQGTAPFTFLWSTGDTLQSIDELSTGDYSVIITDDKGCESNYDFFVGLLNSITSFNDKVNINLSPNPVSIGEEVSMKIQSNLKGQYKLTIHNLLGGTVQNIQHSHMSETSLTTFALPSAGLYLVSVEYENVGKQVFKLMVSD